MTSRQRLALVLVLAVAPVLVTATQAPRGVMFREGTASIAGLVLAADGGKPIARATVVVGGGLQAGFTIVTDEEGRFAFDRLPPGQFTLTASKPSYLPMSYGQAEPGRGSGLPIDLKEGERRQGIQWALSRAATIAGRVLDERGQPMREAWIGLQQRRIVDGERKLVLCCGESKTDANGIFRVTGLLPGEYAVSALPPADYRFTPEVLSSFGDETRRVSDEEVRWALREIEIASGRATSQPPLPEPLRGRTVSYGRIYYPGTPEASRVTMVTVKAGEDRGGVDFSMTRLPTAFIKGRAIGLDGQPAVDASLSFYDGWSTTGTRLTADGAFERRNLLPGRYTITVRGRGNATWASRIFDVNGADFPDVVLTLGPGASVGGRLVFEQGAGPATPIDPGAVQISMLLRPAAGTLPIRVAADGSFKFAAVDPGRYRLSASVPAANRGPWTLKSITVAGKDAYDAAFDVEAGQSIADAVVTFTTQSTSLSGTLFTADGASAGGYYVVVFSTDRAYWNSGSRRVPPPARASTTGRYEFLALPPGEYALAALTSVDANDLTDPAFLAALQPAAMLVTLGDGEKKTQDVKFARARAVETPLHYTLK
jgi:hypothetical protein